MKLLTPLRMILGVVALGLVAAACGGTGNVAATVNGTQISVAEVESLIADDTEQTDELFSQSLATLIQWTITEQAAEERGVTADVARIDEELAGLIEQFGAPSAEEFAAAQGITEDLLERYVRQLVIQEGITESFQAEEQAPTDEEVQAEIDKDPMLWTTVCAAHILVETEDEANDVVARLESGEDFGELAGELSTDPGSGPNGGDLGCASPSGYVPPFAEAAMEAPIDEPFGPVQSDFGFHILLVGSRTEASLDEVRQTMTDGAALAAVDEWFTEVVAAADVDVPEQYGEWITDPSPQIVRSG